MPASAGIEDPHSRGRYAFAVMLWRAGVGLCIACLTISAQSADDTSRPNIVVILADDLGWSDLGCYGSGIETPNLDALAAGGLRFTQFYNTARCWPSRAALLTGYYAQQVRRDSVPDIPSGGRGVRPDWAPLLPVRLEPFGYRSYHAGKWHVDGMPIAGGFDRSYLLQDTGRFFSPLVHYEDDQKLPAVERDSNYYATTAITDHAIAFLEEHFAHHADRPFFQYVAFTAPHFPLHALPTDIAKYRDRYRDGWEATRAVRWKRIAELGLTGGDLSPVEREIGPPYHFPDDLATLGAGEVNRPLPWSELTPAQQALQADKMAIHAAMVDRMDHEIGRIVELLRQRNVLENTLIVFASDNGASAEIMVRDDGHDPQATPGSAATHLCLGPGWSTVCNTPFRRHKTWVHEGGIRTPFVVHWPDGFAARGELRHTPGHLIDLVPTLLEAVGTRPVGEPLPAPAANAPELPGRSLLPTFAADGTVERDFLWWLHEGNRALRVGDWKLVAAKGEPWELYDLAADPSEIRNLADDQPERVQELAKQWSRHRNAFFEEARRGLQ